ncbi:MAG: NADP-dependent oxidoreductase [Pseudomonadales bacterium]
MIENRKIVLKSRPRGVPQPENFSLVTEQLGDPAPGMALIEVSHISIDAFIRTTLEDESFHGSVAVGATVVALGVGKVLASAADGLAAGDWVVGPTMAQTHAMMPGAAFRKVDVAGVEPSAYLGVLGMTTGLTAYFGLLEVAGVKPNDTVVVSGAAGGVGSVVCQLAAIRGGRVIGVAGGPEKVRYLTETLGADAAIDYKSEDVGARLSELAPNGINVFFDNVGGELLDTVLDRLASGARISICGAISQYDHLKDVRGPSLYLRLAERNSCMCGFTVDRFQERFPEATANLISWMQDGRLKLPEHVERGIDRFPEALAMLFTGGHMGKLLVAP